jgi:hypothetical protein
MKQRLATDETRSKHRCRKGTNYKEAMKAGKEGEKTLNRRELRERRGRYKEARKS